LNASPTGTRPRTIHFLDLDEEASTLPVVSAMDEENESENDPLTMKRFLSTLNLLNLNSRKNNVDDDVESCGDDLDGDSSILNVFLAVGFGPFLDGNN
jgi:hypothetical protein